MELAGVLRVLDVPTQAFPVKRKQDLERVDVAVMTIPSRLVPKVAPSYLGKGINTVDGYDIHGDSNGCFAC